MKIRDLNYTIKYDNNLPNVYVGLTDYSRALILIKPGQTKEQEKITVIHEIVHAYIDALGMIENKKLNHEQVCEFVAHNLDDIMKSYQEAVKDLKKIKIKK